MRWFVHTYSKSGSKTNNYTSKQYCLGSQTLVFGTSNNIVWWVKQYCFIRRSQDFEQWNTCFMVWKQLFSDFYLWFVSEDVRLGTMILTGMRLILLSCWWYFRPSLCMHAGDYSPVLTMCILRIAREGPFCAQTCSWLRGRALSGDSFDTLTKW